MKELMLLMGNALTREFLADTLIKDVETWKGNPTDDTWGKVELISQLVLTKGLASQEGGIEKAMEAMKLHDKAMKLMTPESLQ